MADPETPVLRLASASPRRRDLLASIGVAVEIVPAAIEERRHPGEPPERFVSRMACEKAAAGQRGSRLPTLGADTVVVCDERVFGKPSDEAQAREMLEVLAGRWHRVLSAVTVIGPAGVLTRCVETRVRMRDIGSQEIAAYWATGEPLDKAGGYAIQGRAGVFIERLEGDYSAVVGLPLLATAELLRAQNVDFWADRGAVS